MFYRLKVLSFLCMVLPHTVHTAQRAIKVAPEDLMVKVLAENNTTIMEQWIFDKKIEVDGIWFGASLLYSAVWMQLEPDIPRLLLQAGAQVDGRPRYSWKLQPRTPLFEATLQQRWPTVEVLLSYGANAGADNPWNDNHSYTPHDITITNNVMDGRVANYFSPDKRTTNPFWYLKNALLLCHSSESSATKVSAIRVMQPREKQAVLKIMQARRNNQLKKGNSVTALDMRVLEWLGDTQAGAELRRLISEPTHMPDVLSDMVVDYWLE